jgi:hypothetical protein
MYKRRIEKWKLEKNNKEHEMMAVLHLIQQRKMDGGSPLQAVRVGTRIVSISEVMRYFKRRGIRDPMSLVEKTVAAREGGLNTGRPADDFARYRDFDALPGTFPHRGFDARLTFAHEIPTQCQRAPSHGLHFRPSSFTPAWIDHPLSSTSDEIAAEAVIGRTQYFCTAWFDQNQSSNSDRTSLKALFIHGMALRFKDVLNNLRDGRHDEVFRDFDHISEDLRLYATSLDPAALILILCFVKDIQRGNMDPLSHQFLSYLTKLSEIFHGPAFPFRTITYNLLQVGVQTRARLIDKTLCKIQEVMEKDCGTLSPWAALSKQNTCLALAYRGGFRSPSYLEVDAGFTRDTIAEHANAIVQQMDPIARACSRMVGTRKPVGQRITAVDLEGRELLVSLRLLYAPLRVVVIISKDSKGSDSGTRKPTANYGRSDKWLMPCGRVVDLVSSVIDGGNAATH